jgi:hypothetical protein
MLLNAESDESTKRSGHHNYSCDLLKKGDIGWGHHMRFSWRQVRTIVKNGKAAAVTHGTVLNVRVKHARLLGAALILCGLKQPLPKIAESTKINLLAKIQRFSSQREMQKKTVEGRGR